MNIIEKNNLVDEAYNQLLQMIASGEWVEGSKLPSESQLCETLGVSRNTVRVALSKLNALGLIESRQGFGYSVRNLLKLHAPHHAAALPGLGEHHGIQDRSGERSGGGGG